MTLPASIRVNAQFPFPAMVTGAGLIKIGKSNGIWQVSIDFSSIAIQTPAAAALATDYVLAFDSVTGSFFKLPLSLVLGGARVQRLITSAAALPILASDSIINLNCNAPLAITVPLATSRGGAPLTFKDVAGKAGAQNITLNRTAPDTFDGFNSLTLNTNYQGFTLVPASDGTTAGWSIE